MATSASQSVARPRHVGMRALAAAQVIATPEKPSLKPGKGALLHVGHSNITVGYLVGGVFIFLGLVGFRLQNGSAFYGRDGDELLSILRMNQLSCLMYLGAGALLMLTAWLGVLPAHIMNTLLGALLLLIGLIGVFMWQTSANVLALNTFSNLLHLIIGSLLLFTGLRPIRAFND